MDDTDHQQEPSDDDALETLRLIIRKSLDEIADEIGVAMRNARLQFPLGLTVPNSGYAIVTMVTPDDPSDDDWSHATTIVCQLVGKKLGGIDLRSRPLPCAMVNATINAAEITPNALAFDTRS